jgi:hypothetical protein
MTSYTEVLFQLLNCLVLDDGGLAAEHTQAGLLAKD